MKTYAAALFILTFLLTAYNFTPSLLATSSPTVTVLNPLVVNITPSRLWLEVGQLLTVSTSSNYGTEMALNWGDGSPVVNMVPITSNDGGNFFPSPSHAYSRLGVYTVTATTKSYQTGATASNTVQITVGSTPITVTCDVNPKIGVRPLTVTVTCTGGGGSGIYNWYHTWGDGSAKESSTTPTGSKSLSHTFTTAGAFTITVNNQESNTAYCNVACPLGIWQATYGVADYSQPPQTLAPTPQPTAKPLNWSDPLILLNLIMGVASVAVYTRGGRSV